MTHSLTLPPPERAKALASALGLGDKAEPFPWQTRLLDEIVGPEGLPDALDIPTGLGKTSTLAVWLIARALGAVVPRRLIYVVDRRAVVDQATTVAEELRAWLKQPENIKFASALGLAGRTLPISTLRGQHVDNREWLEDPSLPAVVVGTVDMIGSRLLFGGYGVSRKMRPYHAGLLGHDALIVLDEAHLVPPFEALVRAVAERSGALSGERGAELPPLRLLTLSATGRGTGGRVFSLDDADRSSALVRQRLDARKQLSVKEVEAAPDSLAEEAWRLGAGTDQPQRVVVYVNSRLLAQEVFQRLEKLAAPAKRSEEPLANVELLVGGRRVRERLMAHDMLTQLGFLGGTKARPAKPAFLIATSAGEVGVDLDADHMVCDLVAWERMIQRLGRVNRRGLGDATVLVLAQPSNESDEDALAVYRARRDLLAELNAAGGQAGPGALLDLRDRAEKNAGIAANMTRATSPAPLHPPLTAPTVTDWALTSWDDHPGRAAVGPWLRGWVEDEPQCRLVWRAREHLPFVKEAEDRWSVAPDNELTAYFEAAPPHLSEVLETETWRAVEWLRARTKKLQAAKTEDRLVGSVDSLGFLLGPSGSFESVLAGLDEWAEQASKKGPRERFTRELAGKTLVLVRGVAGLDLGGLLDPAVGAPPMTVCPLSNETPEGATWLPPVPVEGLEPVPAVRFRISVKTPKARVKGLPPGWRERWVLPVSSSSEGDLVEQFVVVEQFRHYAGGEDDRSAGREQALSEHAEWTAQRARALAERLGRPADADLLALAGRLHDEGKRADRWQRAFSAPARDRPYAKTRGPILFSILDGYRHEFGSLRYAEADPEFARLTSDEQDLLLHLIAAHHGFARPLIRTQGCEDAPPSALEAKARAVVQRFFRLQRRWGPWGLAWWESVLRSADQQASRANDEREISKEEH